MSAQSTQLVQAFMAESKIQENLGSTWNGDVNYKSVSDEATKLHSLLALDQKMVLPKEDMKNHILSDITITTLDNYYDEMIHQIKNMSQQNQASAYNLLFRYLFYVRSVRADGKKERLLSRYLYKKILTEFPQTCTHPDFIDMFVEFGYFGDLDAMITEFGDVVTSSCFQVYRKHLNADSMILYNKNLASLTFDEVKTMNTKLKSMPRDEIKAMKHLSLAGKWFKREGKHESSHRKQFIIDTFIPNYNTLEKIKAEKKLTYYQMVMRVFLANLNICIDVGEVHMCDGTWALINHESSPACFNTKYRKALLNEDLKEDNHDTENGNRHPDNSDRVECRKNLMETLAEGNLKGAAQDAERLFKIIYGHTKNRNISSKLSATERQLISAQFNDMISKLDEQITAAYMEKKSEDANAMNPMNIIPVADTSGSMDSANVLHTAIGLAIMASLLSTMKGCMISFSDRPQVFHLNLEGDIFDHFVQVLHGPMGYSTNIDSTYTILLDLMVRSKMTETDFALIFFTDGQFDSMVRYEPANSHQSQSIAMQNTFIKRAELVFKSKGYNLPRTIFWNLNCTSPGFPATASMKGLQLVSGYSQTLMKQVFTGDYKYEVQSDGSVKVTVDPWETFVKALMNPAYDVVTTMIMDIGEGPIAMLLPPLELA